MGKEGKRKENGHKGRRQLINDSEMGEVGGRRRVNKIKLEGKESDVREEERVKENNVMVREEGKQTGRQVKGGENEMRRGEGLKVKGEKKKKGGKKEKGRRDRERSK